MPVKFVIECENGFLSFIQVKGFFKQTVNTFWTCKSKLFMDPKINKKDLDKFSPELFGITYSPLSIPFCRCNQ